MSEKFCPSCDGDGVVRDDELCGLCGGRGKVSEEVHTEAVKHSTRRNALKETGVDYRKNRYYMED